MPSGRRLLIVNADDLGRTPGIDAGIFEAHRGGLVTSATLMVGYPAAAGAAAALAGHPALGVGLHLTLTGGGAPTLPAERVPGLVDSAGRLPRSPEGLAGADPAEVEAEVRSQLDRFRTLTGRLPTHLDSHHHAHRVPAVLEAVIAVARDIGLPVRNASPEVGARLRAAGVATPDVFVERFFGDGARLEVLLDILGAVEPGVTELMCHPAVVDDALRAQSSYADERTAELAALTHPAALAAARARGVELVDFATACKS
jgi:predicted glycoside hydrolase/deacetylase ChbG (UPF0249 family)